MAPDGSRTGNPNGDDRYVAKDKSRAVRSLCLTARKSDRVPFAGTNRVSATSALYKFAIGGFLIREWILAAPILALPSCALAQVQSGVQSGEQTGVRSGVRSGFDHRYTGNTVSRAPAPVYSGAC